MANVAIESVQELANSREPPPVVFPMRIIKEE